MYSFLCTEFCCMPTFPGCQWQDWEGGGNLWSCSQVGMSGSTCGQVWLEKKHNRRVAGRWVGQTQPVMYSSVFLINNAKWDIQCSSSVEKPWFPSLVKCNVKSLRLFNGAAQWYLPLTFNVCDHEVFTTYAVHDSALSIDLGHRQVFTLCDHYCSISNQR